MPADGISLPPKKDFGMSLLDGSKAKIPEPGDFAEGGMTASSGSDGSSPSGGIGRIGPGRSRDRTKVKNPLRG